MKLTNIKAKKANKGMTLIELTVVILVLLSLISVLFIGARAWLRGSDRAQAAILIRNAQLGVRSASNFADLDTPQAGESPLVWSTVTVNQGTLEENVFGPEKFVESPAIGDYPDHPQNSNSFVAGQHGVDNVPPLGDIYLSSTTEPEFFAPKGLQ